jgi:gliding motility-associated-like protein
MTRENYIHVFPKPDALFTFNPLVATLIDPEVVFTNMSTHLYSSYWYFGDGDSSNVKNPIHDFPNLNPDVYQITLIAVTSDGCKDTAIATIPIKPVPVLYAPTAFSPDKDMLNDKFFVTGVGVDESNFKLSVYDRWGELIWKTDVWDSERMRSGEWDGKVKEGEKLAQNGIYKWRVIWYDIDKNEHEKIGTVNLIR